MTTAYDQLAARFTRLSRFGHLSAMAGWDQLTQMPAGGSEARAAALAELDVLRHELLTDADLPQWLARASEEALDDTQRANLREMRRAIEAARVLPASLVEAQSLAGARCEQQWRRCRAENDWSGFLDSFREVVRLVREEARVRAEAKGCGRYEALLDLYEPNLTTAELDRLFGDLRSWLPGLLQEAQAHRAGQTPLSPQGPFPVPAQVALGRQVMTWLGFDFDHGRLDVSLHPFCGGVPEDVRLTTRYREDDCLAALMGIVHETGHACYEQNLPLALRGQPAGLARSMGVHESQSLTFEMQVGRGRAFLGLLQPWLVEHFGDQPAFALDNLVALVQRVEPGLIRVDADEVSYPAHVLLRYDIERPLIEGEIEVEDIPALWDAGLQRLLGLDTRGNYHDGCLQDIHWPSGAFGYFPTYTLGAMLSAQMLAAARRAEPQLDTRLAAGDPQPLLAWLKTNVWQHGSRFTTGELIERATGAPLGTADYQRHLRQRYLGQ